jgi:uncharacterized protein YqgC (DUF456 family)
VAAAIALLLAGVLGLVMPTLACASLILGILVALIVAELVSGRRRQRAGQLGPLEALEARLSEEKPV